MPTQLFKYIKNKNEIKQLISELANTKDLNDYSMKDRMLQKLVAKETYKCQHKTYINKSMRSELNIMTTILSHPKKYKLETPIAHIIHREPDFISYGDACLEAGGGYSENLFWWHVEWPHELKALTIKKIDDYQKMLRY